MTRQDACVEILVRSVGSKTLEAFRAMRYGRKARRTDLRTECVDSAFVNTFARYDLPHRSDPCQDFDMASYGVVKVLEDRFVAIYPDMAWEPTAAVTALADYDRG